MHVESKSEPNQEIPKLTPEEYAQRKAEMLSQIETDMPFLVKQVEYQKLLTELEELRMRQVFAVQKTADIMAPPPDSLNKPQ